MRSAAPRLRRLARRLLALEAPSGKKRDIEESAAFSVCEKLRHSLAVFAGAAGFRSLLSRALALAGDEVRWLKAVHVNAEGSLEGLDEARPADGAIAEGEVALVAELIGLLVTFIGEGLTLGILQEVWPEASLGSLNSEPEKE